MVVKEITLSNKEQDFEMEMYVNVGAMMAVERELKRLVDPKLSFFKGLSLVDAGEITPTLIYIGGFLHMKGNKNPVGWEFFDNNEIDYILYGQELIKLMVECVQRTTNPTVSKKK